MVAFTYMESKLKEDFCLVYEMLTDMFIKEDLFLQVTETDGDLALMIVIEIVFLQVSRRICDTW